MSAAENSNGRQTDSIPEGGILAALPRARPQRASARRAAARNTARATKAETSSPTSNSGARRGAGARATPKKALNPKKQPQSLDSKEQAQSLDSKKQTQSRASRARASQPKKKNTITRGQPVDTNAPRVASRVAPKPLTKPADPPAPKQGYEPEEEFELGNTVNPPSGAELVESVADIVGELANSGLAAGGRLLKDAFSLLRRP